MTDIYEQHSKAFQNVTAYVIVKDGKAVGKVAFKFPRDGASRLWAYVHAYGAAMVRGNAGGYGYDKCSAAASTAACQINPDDHYEDSRDVAAAMREAMATDDGMGWDRRLRESGFEVFQAV